MREFPDECLTVTGKGAGNLFCIVRCEELSLWKNIVANHIGSNKHKSGKEKLALKEAYRDVAECLKAHDNTNMSHPAGETLPMDQRVYRLKVLKTFVGVAVPLSKLDALRFCLEVLP